MDVYSSHDGLQTHSPPADYMVTIHSCPHVAPYGDVQVADLFGQPQREQW